MSKKKEDDQYEYEVYITNNRINYKKALVMDFFLLKTVFTFEVLESMYFGLKTFRIIFKLKEIQLLQLAILSY